MKVCQLPEAWSLHGTRIRKYEVGVLEKESRVLITCEAIKSKDQEIVTSHSISSRQACVGACVCVRAYTEEQLLLSSEKFTLLETASRV